MTIKRALLMAGCILGLAWSLAAAANTGLIEPTTTRRLMGAANGIVLAIFGNVIPKTLRPLACEKFDPARAQAYRRFGGWTFTLAGLGSSVAWLTLPMEFARPVAMGIVASSVVVVLVVTCLIARLGPGSPAES